MISIGFQKTQRLLRNDLQMIPKFTNRLKLLRQPAVPVDNLKVQHQLAKKFLHVTIWQVYNETTAEASRMIWLLFHANKADLHAFKFTQKAKCTAGNISEVKILERDRQ
jgi:hypothetical protein